MRIRLKIALLDVRTATWDVFMPEPFAKASMSTLTSRESVDQALVATLKHQAYEAAVEEVHRRYGR